MAKKSKKHNPKAEPVPEDTASAQVEEAGEECNPPAPLDGDLLEEAVPPETQAASGDDLETAVVEDAEAEGSGASLDLEDAVEEKAAVVEDLDPPAAAVEEFDAPEAPGALVEEIALDASAEPQLEEDEAQVPAEVEEIGEGVPVVESAEQAKPIIEALLFASGEPLTARRLANALGGISTKSVECFLGELAADMEAQRRGIYLTKVADGYQLATRPEYADWILRLLRHKRRSPLSPSALETLAIIAYKQPITRAEIDAIRGVESGGVVHTLMDLGLVEVVGRKEVLGRPQLYGTTTGFLRTFGLQSLEDLPTIQELRERYSIGQRR